MENASESVVLRWWHQIDLSSGAADAFKTALAAVLCIWLGRILGLSHSYWAAVSAIVVMAAQLWRGFSRSAWESWWRWSLIRHSC